MYWFMESIYVVLVLVIWSSVLICFCGFRGVEFVEVVGFGGLVLFGLLFSESIRNWLYFVSFFLFYYL